MKGRFVWMRQGDLPSFAEVKGKDPEKLVRVYVVK